MGPLLSTSPTSPVSASAVSASAVSVLDLFSVGIGPSSSHTVGPMRAAAIFVRELTGLSATERATAVSVDLFGSLAATGEGHGTLDAVVAGLNGLAPDTCDPAVVHGAHARLGAEPLVRTAAGDLAMRPQDLRLRPLTRMERHSNALTFTASGADGSVVCERTMYSIGGGFVVGEDDGAQLPVAVGAGEQPWPFTTARELLDQCTRSGRGIAEVARANELASRSATDLDAGLAQIWAVMSSCIDAGLHAGGMLPGPLGVRRRAGEIRSRLEAQDDRDGAAGVPSDTAADWLQAFAIAVNEENAAGGRVVTAPTNGAAGVIPAVLHHYLRTSGASAAAQAELVRVFLLTAGAVGALVKTNASISGAEAGCQGEVGTAAAMAAAGLAAVLGASPAQVENAAEIAMEHHLGMTCDPVGGLVQIPCIERNAIAAGTAVAAARLARNGDGEHRVSLDTVIATMWATGQDMSHRYKETSLGGLALSVPEC